MEDKPKAKSAEVREFSMAYEVGMLTKMLRLPITRVEFDERYEYGKLYLDENQNLAVIYAKLYVNDDFIGTTPYINDIWGIGYLSVDPKELAWDKVYQQYQQVIFDKIVQLEPLAATIAIKENRELLILNKDEQAIATAYCSYINNDWDILFVDLTSKEKVITTDVRIRVTPPANKRETPQ